MNQQTTSGITVSIEPFYHPGHSRPVENNYLFAYRIHIENNSDVPVQLLRRHWYIKEGTGIQGGVEGEGVVGKKPVIQPGDHHNYVSWCQLQSGIGTMHGYYTLRNCEEGGDFRVAIPKCLLVATPLLN